MRNFGQRICRYCGKRGGDRGVHPGECISLNERKALLSYIAENGRNWRSKLRKEWMCGSESLRELRNTVGPTRLDYIRK